MEALERASGPEYDVAADPGETEWVATRKARFEDERARLRGANLRLEVSRDRNSCGESSVDGQIPRCD